MTARKGVVRGRLSSASSHASCSACCCGVRVKSRPWLFLAVRTRHVAVERQKRNQRIFRGKLKAIPARRHRPAGGSGAVASAARVLELGIDFALGPSLIIMVSQHGIRRAGKVLGRVHLFELCLPSGGAGASRQFAVPVVSQHKQRLRMNGMLFGIGAQAGGHLRLCRLLFVSPIAQHQQLRCCRIRRHEIGQA